MPFHLMRQDLVRIRADAIVNTTNMGLTARDGGVSGAIFAGADREKLTEACRAIGVCPLGQAVITDSFGLPAKKIIHTACPAWIDGRHGEEKLLRSCYRSSLELARQHGMQSVAFPLIGSGHRAFPREIALQAAVSEAQTFLLGLQDDMSVSLALFSKHSFLLSQKLSAKVPELVDDQYVYGQSYARGRHPSAVIEQAASMVRAGALEGIGPGIPFMDAVLKLVDRREMSDASLYKRANMTKQHFHKLKMGMITPQKRAAVALCIGLKLDLHDTQDLLSRAGYVLTPASPADLIVMDCLEQGICSVIDVNIRLYDSREERRRRAEC